MISFRPNARNPLPGSQDAITRVDDFPPLWGPVLETCTSGSPYQR